MIYTHFLKQKYKFPHTHAQRNNAWTCFTRWFSLGRHVKMGVDGANRHTSKYPPFQTTVPHTISIYSQGFQSVSWTWPTLKLLFLLWKCVNKMVARRMRARNQRRATQMWSNTSSWSLQGDSSLSHSTIILTGTLRELL